MTFNRRQFLGSALPLTLGTSALAQNYGGTPASAPAAAQAPGPLDQMVVLSGDALPQDGATEGNRLQALLDRHPKPNDGYLKGGAVTELETRFTQLLGKEDAVFMPTGTLANHIALRILCGEAKHALVQQESHVYRDESDTVTTLSGINLVPLAPGRAAPTIAEIKDAIDRAELGPYPIQVGAIALESPVRRAEGETLPPALAGEIAQLARSKKIPLHLDGARLLLMSGSQGFTVKDYCTPFDTVYVSLYKYLGAPFGAILSGSRPAMAKARALRHLFGGTIYHGWQAALPALAALDGIEQRYASVRAAGERLLQALEKTPGYTVLRVPHASNIAFVDVSPQRQAGLAERLKQANIRIQPITNGKLRLMFNESILRKDTSAIAAAFAAA